MQGLNSFHARLMADLGVPFIDTRAAAVDAQGRYASHLPGKDGVPWLVRAGDGIHMSMKGYRLLTDALATRLRDWGQAARAGKPVTADLVPPPAPAPPEPAPAAADSEPPAAVSTPPAPSQPPDTAAPIPDTDSAPMQLLPPQPAAPPEQTPPPPAEPPRP